MIETLIPVPQTFELVRDRIAEILAVESAQQQALATLAGKDKTLYALRVFVERSNPIGEWTFADENEDMRPIVNVMLNSMNIGGMDGDVVHRQSYDATYHIDCYGYSVSFEDEYGNTVASDEFSAREAQRAAGIARSILMAAEYTYLGSVRGKDQVVGKRWVTSITAFERQIDERTAQKVQGVRIALNVRLQEVSPQHVGELFEGFDIRIMRAGTGEILAELEIEPDSL